MQRILLVAMLGTLTLAGGTVHAWKPPTDVEQALLPNTDGSTAAIERLRRGGQQALDSLFAERTTLAVQRDQAPDGPAKDTITADLNRLDQVIDQVGGARYCSVSRLFWHTDLEVAKVAAAKSGKPILSLRMLGRLSDEYSCANSRFFRTTLYANQDISAYLREHYVLHWQSVRPVPRITVDFGDGRRIERTITGNSAHYVLSVDGRPLDVLPGLYGPQAFLEWLRRSNEFADAFNKAAPEQRGEYLRRYHSFRGNAVARQWQQDLSAVAPQLVAATGWGRSAQTAANAAPGRDRAVPPPPNRPAPPPAGAAALYPRSKTDVESPLLMAWGLDFPRWEKMLDEEAWQKIAALHGAEARLDATAKGIIERENPVDAVTAMRLAITKLIVEAPLTRMIRNLESAISYDTVRNEYLLHRRVHEWFAAGVAPVDVQSLNERVYAELFLTPSSDPWLGLVPPDTYTALECGGLVVEKSTGK